MKYLLFCFMKVSEWFTNTLHSSICVPYAKPINTKTSYISTHFTSMPIHIQLCHNVRSVVVMLSAYKKNFILSDHLNKQHFFFLNILINSSSQLYEYIMYLLLNICLSIGDKSLYGCLKQITFNLIVLKRKLLVHVRVGKYF